MNTRNLKPNPNNPRKISDQKSKMLKKSLDEFGDLSGIVYNRHTQRVVGGHQRLKVLPDSDIVIRQKYDTPTKSGTVAEGHIIISGEKFNYREVDWDEIREKAANIAANKHGGEWDIPALNEWLLDLDTNNFDMELTGFDNIELSNLLAPEKEPSLKDDNNNLIEERYILEIELPNQEEMNTLCEELTERGLIVRVKNV